MILEKLVLKLLKTACKLASKLAQSSVAETPYSTTAPQAPGSLFTVISAGHIATGGMVSTGPVTVKLQVSVFPPLSVTTKVLVVFPAGKVAPEGNPAVCSIPPVSSKM